MMMRGCLLLVTSALGLSLPASQNTANMNGQYTLSNSLPNNKWDSQYSKFQAVEYFDVYSPEISTEYSEVYWTMMEPVPLDPELVKRFAGKTMAIVGYESDQVMRTPTGDVSVPITWAYNHHFEAYLSGSLSQMMKVDASLANGNPGMNNHGAAEFYHTFGREEAELAGSDVPTSQFFSEGNGGEFRKSYHGYPLGLAQLIESPTTFHIQPMQIDTKNRHYNGSDFRPDLLPAASAAPPNASYSGLLECPCTDRIEKKVEQVFTTQTEKTCAVPLTSPATCFTAAATLAANLTSNQTVSSAASPAGCYLMHHTNATSTAYYNSLAAGTECGGGNLLGGGLALSASQVELELQLDTATATATITLSGPAGRWFSVGLGSPTFSMADRSYALVVDGTGNVSERKLGDHSGGQLLAQSVTVQRSSVTAGTRTLVLTRPLAGKTPDHYTFKPAEASLPVISASGSGAVYSYHGPHSRTGATLQLAALDSNTCVCDGGKKGSINGIPFHKNCAPEPVGDLVQQHNPTCWVETYQGGLSCCHHGNILLDKHQTPPSEKLTYHMKFRFWFQPYSPASSSSPASHTNLLRMYLQTEAWAGEYDVPQCAPGTPAHSCVHQITAHFTVKDMMQNCDIRKNPSCWGDTSKYEGIELRYAAGHCHAPSCISMELYHADTGALLCSHYPTYGQSHAVFDELGYLAIPPCMWGGEGEGLPAPTFLPYHANLTSIKRNNASYTHYGEMASWQMRGVLAHPEIAVI